MGNLSLFSILALLGLGSVSVTRAVEFNNAYIQNVESGSCVTMEKDDDLGLLYAKECTCGPYQFWKMEDGEHVINEVAFHPYMDELYGTAKDGSPVGVYHLSGLLWQKWRVDEQNDGSNLFVNRWNSEKKCLHESSSGAIDHWECDEDDPSQKWKIIENPCGKRLHLKMPADKFQLYNPATGKCAVLVDDSPAAWARVVTHSCTCENKFQYWTHSLGTMVSKGTGQCFANWEKIYPKEHPGVVQCACVADSTHRWVFDPIDEDGTFNLVSSVDGRCVRVGGKTQNKPLEYAECQKSDPAQSWIFYDQCHPKTPKPKPPPPPPPPTFHTETVTNVIPGHMEYYFESGGMNWLTQTRYILLQGGHWDSVNQVWITGDGKQIKPNTSMWEIYFGNDVKPSFLNMLFKGGATWNDTFGWMNGEFFDTWKSGGSSTQTQTVNVIPGNIKNFFDAGNMNWLNPTRYTLLQGGRWDGGSQTWYTSDGRQVRPGTPEWQIYFGDLQPSFLSVLFNGGRSSWSDVFGWMTPDFFTSWTSYKFAPTVQYIYDPPEIEYVYDPPKVIYA